MTIQKIKQILKERKITYAQLAEMSGVPKKTLSNIFRGLTLNPRVNTVQAIEAALGIAPEQVETYTYGLTDDEKALLDRYRRLSPSEKTTLFNVINAVFGDANKN